MRSLAAALLSICGAALVVIGGFFVVARPPILPEDARFMGSSVEHLGELIPALSTWLRRVFWVLGGYVASTGILVVYVANFEVRTGSVPALAVLAIAGVKGQVFR